MKYLLDTNICVHLLRGRRDVAEAIDGVGISACCISEITQAELLFGEQLAIRRGRTPDRASLRTFLKMMHIIPVSDSLELYASEKSRLVSDGIPIEDFDLLIACTAVSAGAVLVTENISHMSRVSGVRLENWVSR